MAVCGRACRVGTGGTVPGRLAEGLAAVAGLGPLALVGVVHADGGDHSRRSQAQGLAAAGMSGPLALVGVVRAGWVDHTRRSQAQGLAAAGVWGLFSSAGVRGGKGGAYERSLERRGGVGVCGVDGICMVMYACGWSVNLDGVKAIWLPRRGACGGCRV